VLCFIIFALFWFATLKCRLFALELSGTGYTVSTRRRE